MKIKLLVRTIAKKKTAVPLYLRLTEGREFDAWVKLSTLVDPNDWSNKTGTFKQVLKTPLPETISNNKETAKKLAALVEHVKKAMNDTSKRNREWLQSVVDNFYNPCSGEEAANLNQYIDKYIKDAESGLKLTYKGKRFAYGTLKSIKNFQTLFNEYQGVYTARRIKQMDDKGEIKRKARPLDYSDITIDFYNSFVKFLNDKTYSANTIGKHIKTLKTIMLEAKENGKHTNTEFERKAFRAINCDAENVYLSEDELQRLYLLNLIDQGDREARDIFLIGAWTCQRFSDYRRINKIETMDDGTKVIRLIQQKTGNRVTVPINIFGEGLYKTLMRYSINRNEADIRLPKIYEQDLNERIKSICRLAGVTEKVDITRVRGGLSKTEPITKCTLISSHTARRSGTTNLVNRGVPTLYIMALTGHKTEREFMRYVKLTADQMAKKLASFDYYIGKSPLRIAQ